MKRREVIAGLAAAWPLAARAQQPAMPAIGFLSGRSQPETARLLPEFHRGLAEAGYVSGQNVQLEYRFADGRYGRLPRWLASSSSAASL
jgi:putative tryptophan/tyrosine transport system substrate-binding protein